MRERLHRLFGDLPLDHLVDTLLSRHLALWEGGGREEIAALRDANPEWDFMGRTFLVLADPSRKRRHVEVIDRILEDTLQVEGERGHRYFLLRYADAKPWKQTPVRSQFVDGEIALMLGARRMIEDSSWWRGHMIERTALNANRMEASPTGNTESYPDECWTFCNTAALAALRMADALDGIRFGQRCADWGTVARTALVDPTDGGLHIVPPGGWLRSLDDWRLTVPAGDPCSVETRVIPAPKGLHDLFLDAE